MDARDEYDEIREIVTEMMEYVRHYTGTVIERRLVTVGEEGHQYVQVLATVIELGLITDDLAIWCNPRSGRSSLVPNVGEYVEIYFLNGDSGRPVYLYPALEIPDAGFTNQTIDTDIVYQDIDNKLHIWFDKKANRFEMGNSDLKEAARKEDAVEAIIPAGTVVVSVSGGSGAPAVGTLNPSDIVLDGEITEGSDQIFIGKK